MDGRRSIAAKRQWLLTIDGAPFDGAWLPLTDDGGGNHHCVALTGPKAGTVVHFDHEVGGGRVLTKSFAAFVQSATTIDHGVETLVDGRTLKAYTGNGPAFSLEIAVLLPDGERLTFTLADPPREPLAAWRAAIGHAP